MANEIDTLMELDPLGLSDQDLDQIIAYHRKARANAAAGIKPKREAGPKVDASEAMTSFLGTPKPAAPLVRRR